MKIGESSSSPVPSVPGPPAVRRFEAGAVAAKPEETSIQLTSHAAQWSNTGSAENVPFDAEKVSRIRAAIDRGGYRIDVEALADQLLATAQELLNRRSKIQSAAVLNLIHGDPS